jgi:hypothetical protein
MSSKSGNRLKYTILWTAFLCILVYGGIQGRAFLEGPAITIISPENGATVEDPGLFIRGVAERISYLTLNGRQIFVDEEGRFEEKLLLPRGYTILVIEARDKFDRSTKEVLQIVHK